MIFLSDLIKELQKSVDRYDTEIQALSNILITAKKQVFIVGEHSRTGSIKDRIESAIHDMKGYRQDALNKIESYSKLSRENEIEVMYFQASHGDIRSHEWKEIHKDIKAFSTESHLNEVNSYMSDEVVIYTSEKITEEEAQAIWDYLSEFMFIDNDWEDEDGTGIRFQPSRLFYWNGTEVLKK